MFASLPAFLGGGFGIPREQLEEIGERIDGLLLLLIPCEYRLCEREQGDGIDSDANHVDSIFGDGRGVASKAGRYVTQRSQQCVVSSRNDSGCYGREFHAGGVSLLTKINVRFRAGINVYRQANEGTVMPMESALVIVGIVSAFVLFGAVLAWADFYSRHARHHRDG